MRQIGTLSNEQQARRFEDYLLVQGIRSRVDPDREQWDVWIYEEDQLEQAIQELREFTANPTDARFDGYASEARRKRDEEEKANREYRKLQKDVRQRWGKTGPTARAIPTTWVLIAISTAFSLVTQFGEARNSELFFQFTFFDLDTLSLMSRWPYWEGILSGEIWRLFTPMFMHFDPLHLLFNMMWLHRLGGQMESRLGSWKFLAIALWFSVASSLLQYVWEWHQNDLFDIFGRPTTWGGMSGVVYGLFGFMWMKVRYEPREGYLLSSGDVTLFLIWLVACMTGFLGPVANAAHVGGLIAGCLAGYWRTMIRGPK